MLKNKLIVLSIVVTLFSTACAIQTTAASMIKPPVSINVLSDNSEKLMAIVNKFIPENSRISNPKRPQRSKGIQLKDLDGDGKDELVAVYKIDDAKSPTGLLVLKQSSKGVWTKIIDYKSQGFNVDYLNFADITGDKKPDIIVGWQIGGTYIGMDIFSMQDNQLKNIASDYYSSTIEVEDMPDKNGTTDGKAEIALWKHDTGNSYKVDVLRWDGSKLISAINVYPYYFKQVTQYYEKEVKIMPNAAFLWYYLADAQIKSENPSDALNSIKTGLSIKQKNPSFYPEYSKFEELKKVASDMRIKK